MMLPTIRHLFIASVLLVGVAITSRAQQLGDLFGRSILLNDGGLAGTTKNTVTLIPPVAATLTTDYTLVLPSALPTSGNLLRAVSIVGTTITLDWNAASNASPYEEASGLQNIRRITSLVVGVQATPGATATDLQARHTAVGQTATGAYSIIAGGSENTNSGSNAGILSGNANSVGSSESVIAGGQSNTIGGSAQRAFIGGGANNGVNGNFSTVVGGQTNAISSGQYGFIGGGNGNSVSVNNASIVGGVTNTISGGQYGAILGGESNTVTGNSSAILGGQLLTVSGSLTLGFNSGSAMSIATSNVVVFGSNNVWLANNNGNSSEMRFYEANGTTGAFPPAATNYVAFKASQSASMSNDNTYTLPTSIGSAGQVLRVASSPAPTATTAQLDWVTVNTPAVVTQAIVADNTLVTVAATTSFLRLDGNGVPANRTVTLSNGTSDGQFLVIRGFAFGANGIELQDAGNLRLSGDVQLNNTDTITLIWDATSTVWIEVARRNN